MTRIAVGIRILKIATSEDEKGMTDLTRERTRDMLRFLHKIHAH